ncbi:zinc finger protein 93 [Spodoptera frugiperda]|nr:zinc finger protein 93 [Spodoptera frugiperda]
MAETSTMNSDNKVEQNEKKQSMEDIKTESEVQVKHEQLECVTCASRSHDCVDIYSTRTLASGAKLTTFLHKYTQTDLASLQACSKYMCKTCYDLINVLEQAELEYFKLKETFEAIISKNPLFESHGAQPVKLTAVKAEFECDDDDDDYVCDNLDGDDSDDEPLATQSKRKRYKLEKKKKKVSSNKRKSKANSDSWKCDECGVKGSSGGEVGLAAHKLAVHTLDDTATVLPEVKIENSAEGSQSPLYNNGYGNCLKVEIDNCDDYSLAVDDLSNDAQPVKKKLLGRPVKTKMKTAQTRSKKVKVIHQCDQCDAKYSSLARLEQHKQKHDGSKPPYICEVCGAHYKHKRACDIHIALHKGISDWKCEECNKLFPSKNALQRHNNIHTGKLNYQCDLCGKSFIHTSSFKMHKLSHSGLKPHACDVCGLALMTRSHLKRHKRVHSGEKRHECAVCGKRFSERYNLAAHSKSHDASDTAPAAPRRHLFRCPYCPERFERRYMLERHVSCVHGRTLERPPPTPRNTMSKLLKAQAQRALPHHAPVATAALANGQNADTKDDRSSDSRTTPITPQKLIAQLSSTSSVVGGAWGSTYAAEFLRHEYPH